MRRLCIAFTNSVSRLCCSVWKWSLFSCLSGGFAMFAQRPNCEACVFAFEFQLCSLGLCAADWEDLNYLLTISTFRHAARCLKDMWLRDALKEYCFTRLNSTKCVLKVHVLMCTACTFYCLTEAVTRRECTVCKCRIMHIAIQSVLSTSFAKDPHPRVYFMQVVSYTPSHAH